MNTKNLLIIIALFYGIFPARGQVGIGTSNPQNSAVLELDSPNKNKALLLARVALTGTNDVSTVVQPTIGMLVYNTANSSIGAASVIANKMYQWDGTKWQLLLDSSSLSNLGIPKQVLSVNAVANQQDLGLCPSTNINGGNYNEVSLPVENVDVYNAWNPASGTSRFVVPAAEGGTYVVNYQSYHYHTPGQYQNQTWFIVMGLEVYRSGQWQVLTQDTRSGIGPNDGDNSSVLFWTGTLNAGETVRVTCRTNSTTSNKMLGAGLAITKL